jgi:hypothetical protein
MAPGYRLARKYSAEKGEAHTLSDLFSARVAGGAGINLFGSPENHPEAYTPQRPHGNAKPGGARARGPSEYPNTHFCKTRSSREGRHDDFPQEGLGRTERARAEKAD